MVSKLKATEQEANSSGPWLALKGIPINSRARYSQMHISTTKMLIRVTRKGQLSSLANIRATAHSTLRMSRGKMQKNRTIETAELAARYKSLSIPVRFRAILLAKLP